MGNFGSKDGEGEGEGDLQHDYEHSAAAAAAAAGAGAHPPASHYAAMQLSQPKPAVTEQPVGVEQKVRGAFCDC